MARDNQPVDHVAGPVLLYLGADWWGSDARALAVALRRRGALCIEENYEDFFPIRWDGVALRAARRLLKPFCRASFNRAVRAHADRPGLDAVVVFKGMLLEPETLRAFARRGVRLLCVYPDVSFADHGREIETCLPLYDAVFTTKTFHGDDPAVRARARAWHAVRHGYDPDVHRPVRLDDRARAAYGCDVSFVGCRSPKKEQLLRAVIEECPEATVRVWGPGWGRAAPGVRAVWQGRGVYGDELALVVAASRINLGLLSEAGTGVASGDRVTARTWQIPACGGFLLHEDTPEFASYFIPHEEAGVFRDARDLPEAVRRYRADEALRERVRARGAARCRAEAYTYEPMARAILDQLHVQAIQHSG